MVFWLPALALAQPSGGPYGPVQQTYEVPKDAAHVYYVAPDGKKEADGTKTEEPTSLEAAIERVVTGDAIILRGGTYRTGGLKLNQSVTIQPFKDERPIINGTKIATDWENLHNGQWRTKWATLFPSAPQDWWRREREAARTPLYKFNNDLVFADGKRLHPVGWAGDVKEDTYWVDYEKGFVYIGTDPAKKQIEITAFDSALIQSMAKVHDREPDHKGSTIRGITFTQYAYRALEIEGRDPEGVSPEAEHGNDVAGAVFENCTISHCSRVAGYFRGNHLVIRHCLVSDTGTEGIYVLGSNDILLERNIVTRNNVENITGYYASAVKIFNQCYRATCRENLIIDNGNGSCGVWYDVGEVDGVFVNNWVERTDNGFFFEISKGATCAGNVFVDCGTGIKILNSRDVHVYQNTLVDSTLWIERSPRSAANDHFGWHPATGSGRRRARRARRRRQPDLRQRGVRSPAAGLRPKRESARSPHQAAGRGSRLQRLRHPRHSQRKAHVRLQHPDRLHVARTVAGRRLEVRNPQPHVQRLLRPALQRRTTQPLRAALRISWRRFGRSPAARSAQIARLVWRKRGLPRCVSRRKIILKQCNQLPYIRSPDSPSAQLLSLLDFARSSIEHGGPAGAEIPR